MFLVEANKFLGTNHFVFLGISVIIIVTSLIIFKKKNVSFNTVLNIMLVVAVLSELIKIGEYIEPYTNEAGKVIGVYFDKEGLPFHLCSIQIIFLFAQQQHQSLVQLLLLLLLLLQHLMLIN